MVQAHQVALAAEHALIHAVPRLAAANVHTDHAGNSDVPDPHAALNHHPAVGLTG